MSLTSKALVLAIAGALTVPALAGAEAGGRHRHNDAGAALAAGAIGLAAGAILGSTLSQPRYVEPAPVYVAPPPPPPAYRERVIVERRYYDGPEYVDYAPRPWTREWYRYCASRYRSFDPQTGTYVTYGGAERFCR